MQPKMNTKEKRVPWRNNIILDTFANFLSHAYNNKLIALVVIWWMMDLYSTTYLKMNWNVLAVRLLILNVEYLSVSRCLCMRQFEISIFILCFFYDNIFISRPFINWKTNNSIENMPHLEFLSAHFIKYEYEIS